MKEFKVMAIIASTGFAYGFLIILMACVCFSSALRLFMLISHNFDSEITFNIYFQSSYYMFASISGIVWAIYFYKKLGYCINRI